MSIFDKINGANADSIAKVKSLRDKPIKASTQFILAIGAFIFGLLALGLFILEIVKGILALILLVTTAVVGFVFIKAIYESGPAIQQKIRNRKMAMMMKEARVYAIEQLQNEVLRKTSILEDKKKNRDRLGAMVAKMKSTISQEPANSKIAEKMSTNLTSFEANYNKYCSYITQQKQVITQYEQEVANAKKLDEFNTVASEFMSLMTETTDSKLEEMLSVASFAAIEDAFEHNTIAMNNVMADLEM